MYNGIGLQTVRGTGTSGHVQRNVAALRGNARRGHYPRGPPPKSLHAALRERVTGRLGAQPAFAAHENRRKVEVAVVELEEELVARGYEKDTIEEMKKRLRADLLERDEMEKKGEKDRQIVDGRMQREEGRPKATAADEELIARRNERMKEALGVSEDYQEGDFLRRMQADKEKQKGKENGAGDENTQGVDTGKNTSTPGSNVVQLQNKDAPDEVVKDTGETADGAGQASDKLPADAQAGALSGSESSVLTPTSPSSESLPSQRYAGGEDRHRVSPRQPPSPTPQKRQRGGDVLLEESLKHVAAPIRKRDDIRRPLSDTSNDPGQDKRRANSPDSDSYRDEPTRGDRFRDEPIRKDGYHEGEARRDRYRDGPARKDGYRDELTRKNGDRDEPTRRHSYHDEPIRGDGYRNLTKFRDNRDETEKDRDVRGIREHSPTDGAESALRNKHHKRRTPREYSESPRRYGRSLEGKRRSRRSRRARYSDEDDSYDSYSPDSPSPSPRRRRRSPSPHRGDPSRSASPPRKRYRDDGYDEYSRRIPSRHMRGEKERDQYQSYPRDRSRSPGRSRSSSPPRQFQRSASPKRDSRRNEQRRQRWGDDPYDSDWGNRNRGSYRRGRDRRDRYRSPSPKARDHYRSPSSDRYRSPSVDRDRDWRRNASPERRNNRDDYREPHRQRYDDRPPRSYRSISHSPSRRRRFFSP